MGELINIIGPGAVGSFYGGKIEAKRKGAITFVGREPSFSAIQKNGLVLNMPSGIHLIYPRIIEHISEIVNPKVVILTVKSYDLDEVARELSKVVKPKTTIITLQNGLDNDLKVLEHLYCEVLPGLVLVAATKTSPYEVVQKGEQQKLVFGPRDGKITPKMKEIYTIFKEAGIDAVLSENITLELWKKFLFVVSFSSATVAGRCSIGEALSNPELLNVYSQVLREAIAVGEKEEVIFEPNIFEKTLEEALKFDPSTKSSLLVDLENNRPTTEVEALQGAMIRLAKKHGLAVPATLGVYEMI
ncbi:2-dehydropantoate 2-reductase [Candidatus Roizmanbacteria bacterium]|nr:2-dehydropantoate 2-reductase [Candidatus Roizmanbacteria bacterium]